MSERKSPSTGAHQVDGKRRIHRAAYLDSGMRSPVLQTTRQTNEESTVLSASINPAINSRDQTLLGLQPELGRPTQMLEAVKRGGTTA